MRPCRFNNISKDSDNDIKKIPDSVTTRKNDSWFGSENIFLASFSNGHYEH